MTYKGVMLVTGGSRGIGKATVEHALSNGWHVAFTYCHSTSLANEIVSRSGQVFPEQKCLSYKLDLKRLDTIEALCDHVIDDFGDLDALVCNAGTDEPGNIVLMSNTSWERVITTNLTGHFCIVRYFLPHFISKNYGRIITLSSLAMEGSSGQAAYAASKGALTAFAKTVAKEYGSRGITSNIVIPGMIATDMIGKDPKGLTKFFNSYAPNKKLGSTYEVASLILFLASKESSYINSATINVTGGIDWVY